MPEPSIYTPTEPEAAPSQQHDTDADGFDFLDDDKQPFEEPESYDALGEAEPIAIEAEEEDPEDPAAYQRTRYTAQRNARRYVGMANRGIAALASTYAGTDADAFTIDKEDEEQLASPLAEIIRTNKAMDLPPGWMLVITALIIYFPLAIKAIGLRKEKKRLEEATKKANKAIEDGEKEAQKDSEDAPSHAKEGVLHQISPKKDVTDEV